MQIFRICEKQSELHLGETDVYCQCDYLQSYAPLLIFKLSTVLQWPESKTLTP